MPASCSAVTRRITKAQAANSTSAGSSAPGRTLPEQPRRAHEATPRGHSTKKPHQAIAAKATASPTRTTLPAQGLDDVASVLQQFATSMQGRFDQLDTSMRAIDQRLSAIEPMHGQITTAEVAPWTTEIAAARSAKRISPTGGNDSLAILETAITQARAADSYAKKPWYILHPQGAFCSRWDIVSSSALIFTAIFTPAEVALLPPTTTDGPWPVFITNRATDAVFLFDMILQFFLMFKVVSYQGMDVDEEWVYKMPKSEYFRTRTCAPLLQPADERVFEYRLCQSRGTTLPRGSYSTLCRSCRASLTSYRQS